MDDVMAISMVRNLKNDPDRKTVQWCVCIHICFWETSPWTPLQDSSFRGTGDPNSWPWPWSAIIFSILHVFISPYYWLHKLFYQDLASNETQEYLNKMESGKETCDDDDQTLSAWISESLQSTLKLAFWKQMKTPKAHITTQNHYKPSL